MTNSVDSVGPGAEQGSVRTEIPFNDGVVLEIYHIGSQATETEVKWERRIEERYFGASSVYLDHAHMSGSGR